MENIEQSQKELIENILPYIPYDVNYGMDYGNKKVASRGILSLDHLYKVTMYDWQIILTPLELVLDNYLGPKNDWQLLRIGSHDYDMLKGHRTTMVSFGTIKKFYEHHIDFQGLIRKGFAIDGTKIPNFEIKKPKEINYYG